MLQNIQSEHHFLQILESKGDIGVFPHLKAQPTAPKEFHFSTDDRLGPPAVVDLFDKVRVLSHASKLIIFLSRNLSSKSFSIL